MPYSSTDTDALFLKLLHRAPISTAIDLGAGAGKYGRYLRQHTPAIHITAIEVEGSYIEPFKLNEVYDEVRRVDAMDLIHEVDRSYDLVIMGDFIEHLRKSDGIDLLNFFTYRAKYLWVVYPERFIQGSYKGVRSEAHLSVWSPADFAGLDAISFRSQDVKSNIVAVAVNGYRLSPGDPTVAKLLGAQDLEGRVGASDSSLP